MLMLLMASVPAGRVSPGSSNPSSVSGKLDGFGPCAKTTTFGLESASCYQLAGIHGVMPRDASDLRGTERLIRCLRNQVTRSTRSRRAVGMWATPQVQALREQSVISTAQ